MTGRKVSKFDVRSSDDQLLRLSEVLLRSREPRRVNPISVAFLRNCSKLLPLNLRSERLTFGSSGLDGLCEETGRILTKAVRSGALFIGGITL